MQRVFYRLMAKPALHRSLEQVKSCCKVCVGNHDVQEEFLVKAGFCGQPVHHHQQPAGVPALLQSGAAQLLIADPDQLRSQLAR
jgi:hypothetical protein